MGFMGKTGAALALSGALLLSAGAAQAVTVVQEGFNENATPDNLFWFPNEVGWFWTPESDFSLTGIRTTFRSVGAASRTVTVVLMDDRGGSVLASGSFDTAGGQETASFAAFDVDDAVTYFVGFQNVKDLGINIVGNTPNDEGFEAAPPAGFGDDDAITGNFANAFTGGNPDLEGTCIALGCPIIAFLTEVDDTGGNNGGNGDVPEPATLILLCAGLSAMGWARRRQTRQIPR